MNYLSLITSLSKDDMKDLAKQMRVCCSGNKTQICDRILKVLDTYEGQTGGGTSDAFCDAKGIRLPKTAEATLELFEKMLKEGIKVDGRWFGDFRVSTGYPDHTVYLEACEKMVYLKILWI